MARYQDHRPEGFVVDAAGTCKLSNLMSTCFSESVSETQVLRALLNSSLKADGQSRITITPVDGDITIWVRRAGGDSNGSVGGLGFYSRRWRHHNPGVRVTGRGSGAGSNLCGIGILPWRESRPLQSRFTEKICDSRDEARGSEEVQQGSEEQEQGYIDEARGFHGSELEWSALPPLAPGQQPGCACLEVVEISDEDEEPSVGSPVERPGRVWTVHEYDGVYWWAERKRGDPE